VIWAVNSTASFLKLVIAAACGAVNSSGQFVHHRGDGVTAVGRTVNSTPGTAAARMKGGQRWWPG
jgi:hypothetical protein